MAVGISLRLRFVDDFLMIFVMFLTPCRSRYAGFSREMIEAISAHILVAIGISCEKSYLYFAIVHRTKGR